MHNRFISLAVALALLASTAVAQSGRLDANDAQLDSGEYFEYYERELQAGEAVSISISSPDFDPYLMVVDSEGNVDFQADDSEGMGLDVREQFTATDAGTYLIVVTTATAGETGDYTLLVETMQDGAPTNPLGTGNQTNPLALPPLPSDPFVGVFSAAELSLELQPRAQANPLAAAVGYQGQLLFNGAVLPVTAQADGVSLTGTFTSQGSDFTFTATLDGSSLRFETGGAVYLLQKETESTEQTTPANPLAAPGRQEGGEGQQNDAPPAEGDDGNGAGAVRPTSGRLFEPRLAVTPPLPAVAAEPFYIKGLVVDQRGEPLAGATVSVYGTTIAGEDARFETRSQADGSYRQRVPDGIYGVSAIVERSYAGDNFEIYLATADGTQGIEHDAAFGGVENFVWYLEGLERAGLNVDNESSYHGMYFRVQQATGFMADPQLANNTVEVTLTPAGPLLDGSEGQTLVYRHTLGSDENITGPTFGGNAYFGWDLYDIPLGSYTMTARLIRPDGTTAPLRVSSDCCDPEALAASVTFHPVAYEISRSPEPFLTKYVAP